LFESLGRSRICFCRGRITQESTFVSSRERIPKVCQSMTIKGGKLIPKVFPTSLAVNLPCQEGREVTESISNITGSSYHDHSQYINIYHVKNEFFRRMNSSQE
jgi:hypothetical protein